MTTKELCQKWGLTEDAVEALRRSLSGTFRCEHRRAGVLIDQWEGQNLVTNEGLDHALDATLAGGTQITTWYLTLFKDDHTPAAGNTYATPGYTEIAGADVDESTRQVWTAGDVSSQGVDNTGDPAVYTADGTFTAFGAALVGGGSAPTTIANTAGGGTLYSLFSFAASKALTATDTITVTYSFTGADAA